MTVVHCANELVFFFAFARLLEFCYWFWLAISVSDQLLSDKHFEWEKRRNREESDRFQVEHKFREQLLQ